MTMSESEIYGYTVTLYVTVAFYWEFWGDEKSDAPPLPLNLSNEESKFVF